MWWLRNSLTVAFVSSKTAHEIQFMKSAFQPIEHFVSVIILSKDRNLFARATAAPSATVDLAIPSFHSWTAIRRGERTRSKFNTPCRQWTVCRLWASDERGSVQPAIGAFRRTTSERRMMRHWLFDGALRTAWWNRSPLAWTLFASCCCCCDQVDYLLTLHQWLNDLQLALCWLVQLSARPP